MRVHDDERNKQIEFSLNSTTFVCLFVCLTTHPGQKKNRQHIQAQKKNQISLEQCGKLMWKTEQKKFILNVTPLAGSIFDLWNFSG